MRLLFLSLCVVACTQAGAQQLRGSTTNSGATAEEIIFIAPSRTGKEIRAITPDGSDRRQIFALPDYTTNDARIWELSASPDGQQIAFSSDHDWDRSYHYRNVYVIDAEGENLKRPSDAPSIPELAQYQTGKVQLEARRLLKGGELSAWVQGAKEPSRKLLRQGQTARFVVDVADFGPGVQQYARVYNHHPGYSNRCSYDPAVRADIVPGKTVNAGPMPMLFAFTCGRVYSPGWIDNETLVVIYTEPDQSVSPHNIWTVKVDIKPDQVGTRWFDTRGESGSNRITRVFAGAAEGDKPAIVAFRSGAFATGIYAAPANDPASMTGGHATICGTLTCKLTSIDATPSGEITILTAYATATNGPDFSAIYLSRNDGAFEQVLKLENEAIGTAAISPDGSQIVFDRAKRLRDSYQRVQFGERPHCPCSIWRIDSDGQGLKKIADDGRAPDWSR